MRPLLATLFAFINLTGCAGPRAPIVYPTEESIPPIGLHTAANENKAWVFDYGFDALSARVRLLRSAQDTADLQYYIWHSDYSGRVLMHEVLTAADRGVRVRIILDGMGAKDSLSRMRRMSVHENVEVRVFNNTGVGLAKLGNVFRINSLQRRMHNKLMVIDDAYALTGGRNVGDDYFWTDGSVAFVDMDIMATGPVVKEAADSFETYWQSPRVSDIQDLYRPLRDVHLQKLWKELRALQAPEPIAERINGALTHDGLRKPRSPNCGPYTGPMRFFADDPEKTNAALSTEQRESILMIHHLNAFLEQQEVKWERVDIANAYFIPGEKGLDRIRSLGTTGCTIRVLTNSLMATDVPMVHAAYGPLRKSLLDSGVELWELRASAVKTGPNASYVDDLALHTKMMIIDERMSVIGSSNMDPRSRNLNTELAMVIDNPECAKSLRDGLNRLCQPNWSFKVTRDKASRGGLRWTWADHDGELRESTSEPHRNLWRGFWQNVYGRIVPISVL